MHLQVGFPLVKDMGLGHGGSFLRYVQPKIQRYTTYNVHLYDRKKSITGLTLKVNKLFQQINITKKNNTVSYLQMKRWLEP